MSKEKKLKKLLYEVDEYYGESLAGVHPSIWDKPIEEQLGFFKRLVKRLKKDSPTKRTGKYAESGEVRA